LILIFTSAGLLLLRLAGSIFIDEVVQDVSVQQEEQPLSVMVVGEKAPFWELTNLAGLEVPITQYLGMPLVLTFWTTWNDSAATQITIFDSYLTENGSSLWQIATINSQEDKSVVNNFMNRAGYAVPVFLDDSGEIGEAYRIRNLPTTYFIDAEGIIRDVVVGVLSKEMFVNKIERTL